MLVSALGSRLKYSVPLEIQLDVLSLLLIYLMATWAGQLWSLDLILHPTPNRTAEIDMMAPYIFSLGNNAIYFVHPLDLHISDPLDMNDLLVTAFAKNRRRPRWRWLRQMFHIHHCLIRDQQENRWRGSKWKVISLEQRLLSLRTTDYEY